jgi:hypothetical protein
MVSKLVGSNLLIIDEFGMKAMSQNSADTLLPPATMPFRKKGKSPPAT